MSSWKIAIVGAGNMAAEHARAFASLPGVQIVGFCGRTRSRAAELARIHGALAFDSISAMYRTTQADAVVVAVNELSMRDVCLSAFSHPWLCLLEKPVGIDLVEAQAIQAVAQRVGARAFVAFNRRSYASTQHALSELDVDNSPRLISVLDQQDLVTARDGGQPDAVLRNYMYANSIHLVDYLILFGRGEVVSVQAIVPWTPERPGHVVAVVRYSSGDSGVYQAVWDGPGPWAVSVTNRKLRVELRPLEKLSVQRRGERRLADTEPDPIDVEFKPGLRRQAEKVVSALSGARVDLATLEDATRSMELCANIYGLQDSER